MATFDFTATGVGTQKVEGNLHVTKHLQVDGGIHLNDYGAPVYVKRLKLVVSAGGAAGVHTASASLPAGAMILNVIVHCVAVWNAGTSATLKVGDAADDDGFFINTDLKATDLTAAQSISFDFAGGEQGADVDVTAAGAHVRRRYLATARVVSAILTLVGTAATTGETYIDVIYTYPESVDVTTGTFVAS